MRLTRVAGPFLASAAPSAAAADGKQPVAAGTGSPSVRAPSAAVGCYRRVGLGQYVG